MNIFHIYIHTHIYDEDVVYMGNGREQLVGWGRL